MCIARRYYYLLIRKYCTVVMKQYITNLSKLPIFPILYVTTPPTTVSYKLCSLYL